MDPVLNAHNKEEYPPMHTAEFMPRNEAAAFSESATKAYANGTQQVPQNDANVNATVKVLTSLLGAL
jgi:hypothetical protein